MTFTAPTSFPSSAAKSRALDDLNREYAAFRKFHLDELGAVLRRCQIDPQTLTDAYQQIPLELHQVRTSKLSDTLLSNQVDALTDLVARRAAIKAVPVVKAPAKSDVKADKVQRRAQANPVLVEVFQGDVKAQITQEFEDNYLKTVARLLGVYGYAPNFFATRKAKTNQRDKDRVTQDAALFTAFVKGGTLNLDRIRASAAETAQAEVDSVLPKMLLKLGRTEVTQVFAEAGGIVRVLGTLDGKAVCLSQTRTLNVSPLGRFFYQYPALLYIDGKRIVEAQFAKLAD